MNNKEDCVFCKIISKEIPSSIIYEDSEFLGFLDINPIELGHSLIIPKEHHIWMQDTPDDLVSKSFITAKKIMIAMEKSLGCDLVQLVVTGKDVPHFHINLIPRKLSENLSQLNTIKYKDDKEKEDIATRIKNAL